MQSEGVTKGRGRNPDSQREGRGAQARGHSQLLGVADAVIQHVDLRRREGDAETAAGGRAPPTPPPCSGKAQPAQPGTPAGTGLTSYFCCFSFAIKSNFSDSSWWIQSDSSCAFSLAGQKGCHGGEPGRAPGPEGLRELSKATQRVSEFGLIGVILLIFEAKMFKVNCGRGF